MDIMAAEDVFNLLALAAMLGQKKRILEHFSKLDLIADGQRVVFGSDEDKVIFM
jgi:hypothetical protein